MIESVIMYVCFNGFDEHRFYTDSCSFKIGDTVFYSSKKMEK